MYSIFVTINVKAGKLDKFHEACLGDAQGSTRDEPGCFRFDIHQDKEIKTRFYFYEVYRDEDAFKEHLESDHFRIWRSRAGPLFDGEPTKYIMETIFPSEDGWEKQKLGLLNW